MAIYELTPTAIRPIEETTFRRAEIRERQDLQRLLRARVDVIGRVPRFVEKLRWSLR
jgi:hypothetical protein